VEVVALLSQGRTTAAQCGLFTYKSVLVIFEPPCTKIKFLPGQLKLFKDTNTIFYENNAKVQEHCVGIMCSTLS